MLNKRVQKMMTMFCFAINKQKNEKEEKWALGRCKVYAKWWLSFRAKPHTSPGPLPPWWGSWHVPQQPPQCPPWLQPWKSHSPSWSGQSWHHPTLLKAFRIPAETTEREKVLQKAGNAFGLNDRANKQSTLIAISIDMTCQGLTARRCEIRDGDGH